MLFAAMVVLTLGYVMMYSALHGDWRFWHYFFPSQVVSSTPAPATTAA